MESKIYSLEMITSMFKDGQTLAIGGFANHGSPNRLIQAVIDSGAKHLTVISIDSGDSDTSIGRLIHRGLVDKIICSHIGKNFETVKLYEERRLEVELNPQGTIVERIRCGGTGLGGVLTKTGLGTIVEEKKQIITVNGEQYLLETALKADVALVRARKADPIGNLAYRGTNRNSNPIVAMAADLTIVEADMIVELNELDTDSIVTPGVYVNMILTN